MDMNQIQQRYQQFMANQPNQGMSGNDQTMMNQPGMNGTMSGINNGMGQFNPGGMGQPGGFNPGIMGNPPGNPMQNNNPVMAPDAQQQDRRQALAQMLIQKAPAQQAIGGQQPNTSLNSLAGMAGQFAAGNNYAQNHVTPDSVFQKAYTPDTFDAADAENMKNVGAMRTNRFAGML